jgi:hypothetical protein
MSPSRRPVHRRLAALKVAALFAVLWVLSDIVVRWLMEVTGVARMPALDALLPDGPLSALVPLLVAAAVIAALVAAPLALWRFLQSPKPSDKPRAPK